jgi:hypothetical protein
MAYSKGKLNSSGDKASPCLRPFWIGKLSDKCLLIQTLLCFSVKVGDSENRCGWNWCRIVFNARL